MIHCNSSALSSPETRNSPVNKVEFLNLSNRATWLWPSGSIDLFLDLVGQQIYKASVLPVQRTVSSQRDRNVYDLGKKHNHKIQLSIKDSFDLFDLFERIIQNLFTISSKVFYRRTGCVKWNVAIFCKVVSIMITLRNTIKLCIEMIDFRNISPLNLGRIYFLKYLF